MSFPRSLAALAALASSFSLVACVVAVPPGSPNGSPSMASWEPLGCQQVGMAVDRDSIHVGRNEGTFRAIRLEVAGNDVHIENLTVVYGNGERDSILVGANIQQGSFTGPLDLRGDRRAINRIDLVYRARPGYRGNARVCASGLV